MARDYSDSSDNESDYEEFAAQAAQTMEPLTMGPHSAAVFSNYAYSDVGTKVGDKPINQHLIRQMEGCGFGRMTYIQQFAIPVVMSGRDTLLRSYTGSGKTLCFVVPVLSMITDMKVNEGYDRADGTLAVIVSPTRELCQQTYEITTKLSQNSPYIVCSALTGGGKRKSEKARLRKGVTILMGTPGRLRDHLESTSSFHAPKLKMFILDEADRLLDLGFEKVLRHIYDELVANVRKTSDKEIAKDVLRELFAQQTKEAAARSGGTVNFDDLLEGLEDELASDSSSDEDDEMDMVLNVKGRVKVGDNLPAHKRPAPKKKETPKVVDITEDGEEKKEEEETAVAPVKKEKKEKLQDMQCVLVSATLSPAVVKLAEFCLRGRPAWVALQQRKSGPPQAIVETSFTDLQTALESGLESGEMLGDEGSFDAMEKRMLSVPAHLDQRCIQITLKTRLAALMALILQYGLSGKVVVFFSSTQSVEFHHALMDAIRWPNRMDSKAVGEVAEGLTTILNAVSEDNRAAMAEFLDNDDIGTLRTKSRKSDKRMEKKREERWMAGDDGDAILEGLHESAETARQGDVAGRVMDGIPLYKLHGKLEREDRMGFLADFTKSRNGVLFTTDVAARGLNLPMVDAVIQLDPPQQAEEYAHRVGRTARLDRAGTSILLLTEEELGFQEQLNARGAKIKPSSELALFDNLKNQIAPLHLKSIRQLAPFLGGWIARFVAGRQELLKPAREAFLSARRAYATFSRELKEFFDANKLHLGHLAGAFALKETPGQIAILAKRARDKDAAIQQAEMDRAKRGEAMKKGRQNVNDEFEAAFDDQKPLASSNKYGEKTKKDILREKTSRFNKRADEKSTPGALARQAKLAPPPKKHYTPSTKPQPELATVARSAPAAPVNINDIVGSALKLVSKDTLKTGEKRSYEKRERKPEGANKGGDRADSRPPAKKQKAAVSEFDA